MKYIGLKTVDATPMRRHEWLAKQNRPVDGEDAPGYEVTYPLEPGEKTPYVGWCPARVFEKYNRPVEGMTFGMALEAMMRREVVRRKGSRAIYRLRSTDGFCGGYIEAVDIMYPGCKPCSPCFNSYDVLAADWEIVENIEELRQEYLNRQEEVHSPRDTDGQC